MRIGRISIEVKSAKDGVVPIISQMVDPIIVIDTKGSITEANNAFLEILGYRGEELLGKPFSLFHEISAPLPVEAYAPDVTLEALLKWRERIKDISLLFTAKSGDKVMLSSSASALLDNKGNPFAFVIVARDSMEKARLIEELKRTRDVLERRVNYLEDFRDGILHMVREIDSSERELESAYRDLKETQDQLVQSGKMTALGELASALAHELAQPLTIIKGLSQNLLQSSEKTEPQHEKFDLIVHAAKKMELVIKHLRIFSRKDSSQMRPVDLNSVVKEAFVMVRELLSSHSIEIKFSLSPLPPILGSSTRLEQVIINIITNAKDAMPGGGTIEISTRTIEAAGGSLVRLSISDTGTGIPEDKIKRIFDPFFTTKEPGKGTGLGLSISYGIVKEHNGEITVESAPGSGTAFHITIPPIDR